MNAVDELNFRLGIGPSRPRLPITLQRSGYAAVRQLGKGSFGNAYLVYHAGRQQYYVVKHVNMASMTSRQRKDAHQEIALLQQLDYPNIIRYVEFCEEHPNLYIVMEYADGGDVCTQLKNLKSSVWALGGGGGGVGGLTEAQVISLFVQTTMAVKYMHSRRLLHRDIKSQNVFLTQNHVVKLGDFGISTVLMSTVAMAHTMCGTPCYFSPELCQGKPYNNKSDVWALGVLLYELCTTGRLPFEAATMNRLMDEICNKEPRRIPPSFSEELWELNKWMLKKDPRQRPDAGQILRTPVLVRAIPDVVKKLSATDGRCEAEYKRILELDATPPPPLKPGMVVQPQPQANRGKEGGAEKAYPSAGAAAAAAAAVVGGGRYDLFRKRNDEHPFKRADNMPNARLGGLGGVQQQIQQPKRKEEASKSPPSRHSPVNEGAKYMPALLQDALSKMKKKGMDGNKDNIHNNKLSPVSGANGSHPKGGDVKYLNKERREELAVRPIDLQTHLQNQQHMVQKRSIGRIPLQDLFLLYDENKKRIVREREQRVTVHRIPMNYEPIGAVHFRERLAPAAPEEQSAKTPPKPQSPPSVPYRQAHEHTEEKSHKDQKNDQEANLAAAAAAADDDDGAPEAGRVQEPLQKLEGAEEEKSNEPPGDLALVLREMTNHFASVHSSLSRAEKARDRKSMNATPTASASTAAAAAPGGAGAECPSPEDFDDGMDSESPGQEFADALGTTLDVQGLQRRPTTPTAAADACDGNAGDERIPLSIGRYDVVWSPRGTHALLSQPGSRQGRAVQPLNKSSGNKQLAGEGGATPDAGVGAAAQDTKGEAPLGPVFSGSCLCCSVRFGGYASTIFGSFVCNCLVCSRFSGSMMGVEWLHLPDVSIETLFTGASTSTSPPQVPVATAKPSDDTPAGAGVAAAQALAKGSAAGAAAPSKEGVKGNDDGLLPPPLTKFVVEVPLVEDDNDNANKNSGSNVAQRTGVYAVYFCARCGCTVGMDHGEIEGGLLAKAALSETSLAILESFQQTMPLDTNEMLGTTEL
ncbi:putative protein kinase [Trypanosoma grayi]|uniref:putative protein kinase n=1 Tax=Trypanosoma grayi TaxID=71804 RepID=UPI0004F4AEA7|nr:putative protein kinase [Trypanosoma grayi]KEG06376.1 putative protein kinase [Trypanosoma grayi]